MSRLIAFEGCDGAGKTTVAKQFAQRLRDAGEEVVYDFEPTKSTEWGIRVRAAIQSGKRLSPREEVRCFVKDREVHVKEVIRPALDQSKVVVLDRYYFSTAAYQGIRGLDPESIVRENEKIAPRPWIVFLLDVDPSAAVVRMEGRDGFEPEQQELIRSSFLSLASQRDYFVVIRTSDMCLESVSGLVYAWYLSRSNLREHGG